MENAFLGGWQANGILALASGQPLLFGTAVNNTYTFGGGEHPEVGGNPVLSGGKSIYEWFNVAAFAQPANFTSGNLARSYIGVRTDWTTNLDWMEGSNFAHERLAGLPPGSEPDSAYLQNVVATGHPDSINLPCRGVVTKEGWKYVCLPNQSWMMFNLNEEPYEEANLAMNNAFRAERLKRIARLKQRLAGTGDTFAVPNA